MKKYTGSFNNYNLPFNKLKLKSILSIFTMGLFIFFGFASIEENPPVDCEFIKPPINKTQIITIQIYDKKEGRLIANQTGLCTIIEYEKVVNSDFTCTISVKKTYSKTLNFGPNGKATLTLNRTYGSKEDDTWIQFNLINTNYVESKYIIVKHYHDDHTVRVEFLKNEEYP